MKKFLFDAIDFDEPEVVDTAPTFSEEQLTLARDEAQRQGHNKGYAEGHADAARAAQESLDEKLSVLLGGIAQSLNQLTAGEDRREMEKCIDAARMALHIVHKLMPQLTAQHALPEVERIIASAVDARRDEPRIAVTVAPALLDALKARIDKIAQDHGFAGKLIVIADENMDISDCRVEWADGGSERLLGRLTAQIEGQFTRAIAGMQDAIVTQEEHATPPQEEDIV